MLDEGIGEIYGKSPFFSCTSVFEVLNQFGDNFVLPFFLSFHPHSNTFCNCPSLFRFVKTPNVDLHILPFAQRRVALYSRVTQGGRVVRFLHFRQFISNASEGAPTRRDKFCLNTQGVEWKNSASPSRESHDMLLLHYSTIVIEHVKLQYFKVAE